MPREAGTQGPIVLRLFRTPKWQGPGPLDCPMHSAVAVRLQRWGMGDMVTWNGLAEGSGALQDTAFSLFPGPPAPLEAR